MEPRSPALQEDSLPAEPQGKPYDSQEEVKLFTLTRVWKQLVPILMDDLEGCKTSMEGVTADVVETARELE